MDEKMIWKDNFQFVRNEQEDLKNSMKWETRMSKRYYDRLFKEYALVELAGYKDGKIGMRWRIESELLAGKGQLICASVTCDRRDNLHSYEVPFKYVEQSVHKMELVKVRTCPECSTMLFYKKLTLETEKQQQETRMTSSISSKKRKSGANTAAAVVDSHDEAVEEDVIEVRKPKVKQKVIDLSTLEETTHNDS